MDFVSISWCVKMVRNLGRIVYHQMSEFSEISGNVGYSQVGGKRFNGMDVQM